MQHNDAVKSTCNSELTTAWIQEVRLAGKRIVYGVNTDLQVTCHHMS